MKKLLVLLFSILISFNSYGEWAKVASTKSGDIYSIDKNTIKEHNGFVYWYEMKNYKKRDEFGDMSSMVYMQGDCGINRSRPISGIFYKQPNLRKESARQTPENPEWIYAFPGEINTKILDYACKNIK